MGAHSRSSSDADVLPYNVVLEIVKSHFVQDLNVSDLREEVLLTIFTPTEYAYIKGTTDNAESRCIRLFALLATKNDDVVEQFLSEVKRYHLWLLEKVENVRTLSKHKSDKQHCFADMYFRLQMGMIPKFSEYNIRRGELYMRLRQALLHVNRHDRVALVGALGLGKKWLAIDVCSDYAVAKAMGFQIFWLDMRECTSAINELDKLKELYNLLTRQRSPSPTICPTMDQSAEYARQISDEIRKITRCLEKELNKPQNQNCLVVLANIETKHAIEAFKLPCKLLIITRRKKISEKFVHTKNNISFDCGLTQSEVNLLFEKYLGSAKLRRVDIESIYSKSNGYPLLLSIIAQGLRKDDSWESWFEKLKIEPIDDANLKFAVEKSLQSLEHDLRVLYCRIFSIFPRGVFVPFNLLCALWSEERSAKDDLYNLYDYGFLDKLIQGDNNLSYALPFIYSKNLDDSVEDDCKHRLEKVLTYYNVVPLLENRKKIKLYDEQKHDYFFFSNIDVLLVNADRMDVLAKLSFDFGFLEQKLRSVGLLHTMSHLEKNKKILTENNPDYHRKLRALRKFLPSIEKTLAESKDALLLQCALMESDLIYEMANQQAANFPEHIWFDESGFFHQRHHIYQLHNQPQFVYLLRQNLCLVKTKKEMLLINTSLDHDANMRILQEDANDGAECTYVCVFEDADCEIMLVLYKSGALKLWSNRTQSIKPKNAVRKMGMSDPIMAIDIEFHAATRTHRLHAATRSGKIFVCDWQREQQEFVQLNIPALQTQMLDIRKLHAIPPMHYLVAAHNEVRIWNYNDSSNERGSESVTHLIADIGLSRNRRLLVCGNCIWILETEPQFKVVPFWKLNESLHRQQNGINCAKLLDDRTHLVLGTTNGLFVLNLQSKLITLATNISEDITCIDAKALKDANYKYIIACGVHDKPILNLFALRELHGALEWAHKVPCVMPENGNEKQLPPAVQLIGGVLFDTKYVDGGVATALAVDSKNAIRKLSEHENTIIALPQAKITAITMRGAAAFAGCINGEILNIPKQQYESELQAALNGEAITFLQLLNEDTLIVASRRLCVIVMDWRRSERFCSCPLIETNVKRCFEIGPHHVLIVLESCQFVILNMKNGHIVKKCDGAVSNFYGGCDLRNQQLFLATKSDGMPIIRINDFTKMNFALSDDGFSSTISSSRKADKIVVHELHKLLEEEITCLTVAEDASLVAIGTASGAIWIYQHICGNALKVVNVLLSHSRPIRDMKFSPKKLVLVSCAEQLNFWSVDEILNNPLSPKRERSNSRFQTLHSSDESEEVDATLETHSLCPSIIAERPMQKSLRRSMFDNELNIPIQSLTMSMEEPTLHSAEQIWSGKHGCDAESALLSCVKFAGTEAAKFCANPTFTRFDVVDNEGCYYVLTVRSSKQTQTSRDNYEPPLHYNFNIQ